MSSKAWSLKKLGPPRNAMREACSASSWFGLLYSWILRSSPSCSDSCLGIPLANRYDHIRPYHSEFNMLDARKSGVSPIKEGRVRKDPTVVRAIGSNAPMCFPWTNRKSLANTLWWRQINWEVEGRDRKGWRCSRETSLKVCNAKWISGSGLIFMQTVYTIRRMGISRSKSLSSHLENRLISTIYEMSRNSIAF